MFTELIKEVLPFSNNYLNALLVFLTFFIVGYYGVRFLLKKVSSLFIKRSVHFNKLLAKSNIPLSILFIIVGAKYAIRVLGFTNSLLEFIDSVANTLIIIAGSWFAIKFIQAIFDHISLFAKKTKTPVDDALVPFLGKVMYALIYVFGFIFILKIWGVNVTSLLAGVGIAGIALGFAMQSTLANIFGGVALILDHTFSVGDRLEYEPGKVGIVEEIGIRSTKVRNFDNELLIIPNGDLANSRIINHSKPTLKARVVIPFGVAYGSNIEKVKKVALDVAKKHPKVLDDPAPSVVFLEMADFSLNMKLFAWVASVDEKFLTKEELTCALYKALNKNKIDIPFPTHTVYVKKK